MASTQHHKIELNASVRTVLGAKVRRIRDSGFIPAVLYGKKQTPVSIQVPLKDFTKTYKAAGESTLVYLNVNDEVHPTIIHDIARDPASDAVIHADFYKVNLSEKIKTNVPIVFVGESQAVVDGGLLIRNVNELEVEALPADLPHEISIDISKMAVFGDQIMVKDIKLGSKVQVHGNPDEIIAVVKEPISEEALKASLEAGTETVDDVELVEKPKDDDAVLDEAEAPPVVPDAGIKKPEPVEKK